MKQIERIYSSSGGLTTELRSRFVQHELENPHRKYGTHHYSLEDFGLTHEVIDKHTTRYREFMNKDNGKKQTGSLQ